MTIKREKWIYWLIGFGCGIVITGLFMTYIGLAIQNKVGIDLAADRYSLEGDKEDITPQNESEELDHFNLGDTQNIASLENEKEIVISFPNGASATEICNILEEEGVVDSAIAFKDYVYTQNKATKLRTGQLIFRTNLSEEEVLNILLGKK